MRDPGYFTKLRRFLTGHQKSSRNPSRRAWRRCPASRSELAFTLESLEPRILLAADLAGAVQAAQVVEPAPVEPQSATVLLQEETSANQPPVAVDDHLGTIFSGSRISALTETFTANDTDPDGDPLTIIAVTPTEETHGTVLLRDRIGFMTIDYQPEFSFNGIARFNYTVSDGRGGTDTASVSVQVGSLNQPPVAVDDHVGTTTPEAELAILPSQLTANDTDPNGDGLTVIAVTPSEETHGTVEQAFPGDFIFYRADSNFSGIARFNYTVSDGRGGTDTGSVSVNVMSLNQAPVANPNAYSVNEDTTLTVPNTGVLGLLANDTDVNNNPLTAALVNGPANGTLTLNADGSFTYTPNSNFNGSDSFTYKANDGNADSNVATVSVTVTSVNDLPTAIDNTATVDEDSGATTIPVLSNDSFAPDTGETLTISAVTQGSNGVVVITGNGTGLTYAPYANFSGNDTFTYTISDGNGGTATATVNMTVTPVNDAPIANAGPPQTVLGGTLVTLNGTASADPDGQTLAFAWTLLTKPAGSAAMISNPTTSKPTFTPDVVGGYTAQLTVTDPQGVSSTATVQITANPLPVAIDIRPGESPNNINLGSGGVVQVAILSSNTFNAPDEVDPVSVTLASASVRLRGNGTPTTTVRDVNGDGREDLIVHINTEALQVTNADTQATLDGKTFGGILIRGTDSIRVVP
jgi:VCBS repeat-containing protein